MGIMIAEDTTSFGALEFFYNNPRFERIYI